MSRALLVLGFLLVSVVVRADVAPPPGYVEQCTLELQTRPGRECTLCMTYYGNPPNYCEAQTDAGYTQACRARGASVWNEVWCKGAAADGGTQTAVSDGGTVGNSHKTDGGGCVIGTPGGLGSQLAALAIAGALGLLMRRRR